MNALPQRAAPRETAREGLRLARRFAYTRSNLFR
jgi:hypothetical protein